MSQSCNAPGVRATSIEAMGGYLFRKSNVRLLEETRNRAAECYFNGTCLVRAISSGRFQKIPFFLRHLWCALIG